MSKISFITSGLLKPIGPYVTGRQEGSLMFLSGIIGINEQSNVPEPFAEQAELVFKHLGDIAIELERSLDDILKLTVFLTDMTYYSDMNNIMRSVFKTVCPARSAIGVSSLPRHAKIEVEAILSMS